MKIIIDTNIFIYREDNKIIKEDLKELLRVLGELKSQVLLHPLSVGEISKDKDAKRKNIIKSKIETYPLLKEPPNPEKDKEFISLLGEFKKTKNELIDISLLYAIFKDAADFLITEDKGIHAKAEKTGVSDRIFYISEALDYFKKTLLKGKIKAASPPALRHEFAYNLNIKDAFFDKLKKGYNFLKWWKKISKQGRKAWVYFDRGTIGAFLLHKLEDEAIDSIPHLPKKKRLKICTLQVTYTGNKMGELFVKMSIDYAIKNNINELYLTHFPEKNDRLITLIEEFGFRKVAKKGEEEVFVKHLRPEKKPKSISEIYEKFYPTFYDGEEVNKFVMPIRPEFHQRLFTEGPRQTSLQEFSGGFIIEGNTIKKAYICHNKRKDMKKGDVILFYRSKDLMGITSVGVVDEVYNDLTDPTEILRKVGKRTVYTKEEIEDMAKKPTKVILFKWHFHLDKPIVFDDLIKKDIIKGPIMSIQELSHKNYLKIKRLSGIDKNFTIWKI